MAETEEPLQDSRTLAGMLPGSGLADELARLPLAGLDEHALVEAMRAARRLTAWAESLELSAIAELDRRRQLQADRYGSWTVEMDRALCDEIAAALTLSGTAAAIRLGIAGKLQQLLPDTGRALAQGRIDGAKARVICDGILGISAELARKVERLVLPEAPRLTARQVAARIRTAIMEAGPEAFEQRRKAAEKGRRLERYDNSDGTGDLAARDLPADAADAAYNYVNALAAAIKSDGDDRPIDAIRADVAVDLLCGRRPADISPTTAAADDPAPTPGRTAPDRAAPAPVPEQATPSADRQEADEPGRRDRRPPTDLAGHTRDATPGDGDTGRDGAEAITKAVREQLTELLDQARRPNRPNEHLLMVTEAARCIADALAVLKIRWCHSTADSEGGIMHGHDGYRPPAGMRRLIQARNGSCTFPTCRRRASACDLDHTIPHHKGGPTCPCNLAPLCRGHHRLKQHPDWNLIQLWPGVLLWISPTGHWYLVGPDP